MASLEVWRIFGLVDEAGNGTTKITETNVHCNTNATLQRATDVVAVPGHTLWYIWVDAGADEEAAHVSNMVIGRCEEHDETKHCSQAESDHKDTTSLQSIGGVSTSDTAEAGDNVGRNSHELSSIVCVAERLDDGRKEE